MFGTLVIAGRDWLLPVAGIAAGAALLLAWDLWRTPVRGTWRYVSAGLKALAFIALGLCLLEPTWVSQRAKPGSNYFLLLADNSESLQIHDPGNPSSRGTSARHLLTDASAPWQRALAEQFQARRYLFDARVQPVSEFSELRFDGRSSALNSALLNLSERFRGQPLAGILVFTDGNATDMPNGAFKAAGLPPVYPVMIGRDRPPRDVAIENVAVSQSAFEDAPVTIQAMVRAPGYEGRAITAQLADANGARAAVQVQTAPADGEPMAFRFQLRPERPGVVFYSLQVSSLDETNQFEQPERSQEATLVNNQRAILVNRKRGPYRLLYVAGRPNWEFKFLNRAMQEDPEMELSALLRIARREPKFEFRGRRGESSNPLFRGFDRTTEETERYDQPVLKRLYVREDELTGGFPKSAEELFAYHAVILDDIEAAFFTADQLSLIQRFVSERGGGFLMLGGQESFVEGRYERTPVGDILPVYLSRPQLTEFPENMKLSLSREGWLQPWARLRSTEHEEKSRLSSMPPFLVLNRVGNAKPAASVIATVQDAKGRSFPALVGQQFGHGRSAALMIGDFWRFGLQNETAQKDLGKAWRQLVRWLVADVPERVNLEPRAIPGDAQSTVAVRVALRDKEFKPLDLATVTLHVLGPAQSGQILPPIEAGSPAANTNAIRLSAESSGSEAGVYTAEFVPRQNGGYFAEVVATDEKAVEIGRAQTGWVADPASEEFRSLTPNRALLDLVAQQTGGEQVAPEDLNRFVQKLPNRSAPITETWAEPLWHRSYILLFALACMIADWGIRRTRGFA